MVKNNATLAYVLKGYPRISETFISNEILLLEQLGFKMHLFSMRHPRENFCHPAIKNITAQVTYLPTEILQEFPRLLLPNIFLAAKDPQRFRQTLAYAGKQFALKRKLATIKHFLQAGYLTNTVSHKQLDIGHIHGHFAHSPTSVTLFSSMLSGIPFSFTAHAKDIYTSTIATLQEKMRHAQFVATCTEYNKEYLENVRGEINCPIHNVYHGIDIDLFHSSLEHECAEPPYKIFTVARLTEKKGLPTIFRALKILKDRGMRFHYTLIGDGDDREKVIADIKDLGLEQDCTLLGSCSHIEVLQEFARSDLFALGCKIADNGDRDGIPNVIVESLAMGVPAISTDVSAIPEILHHEKTGYMVPPSSPELLAAGIERMLTDSELRGRIIREGRLLVEQYFDNKVQTKKLLDIFKNQNHNL